MDKSEEPKIITLSDYVNDNRDLLTIFGVFVGVAAFAGNLSIKIVAAFISIAAVTCATFLAIEIWRRWPKGKSSLLLAFFRMALLTLTVSLLIYCLYFFDAIYPDILFPILTLILLEIEVWLISKAEQRPLGKRAIEWVRRRAKFWKIVIVGALALVTLFFARQIANRIDLPVFKAVVWIATVSKNIKGPIQ